MFLPVVALLLVVAADEPAWRIEITTNGGFTGRGSGSLSVAADGTLEMRLSDGEAQTSEFAVDLRGLGVPVP